jgi:hypothetical protein
MTQKDNTGKGKSGQGSTQSNPKRGTKTRIPAAPTDTADIIKAPHKGEVVQTASASEASNIGATDERGLWKSKVLASYHGSGPAESRDQGLALITTPEEFTAAAQEAMIQIVDRIFDIFQNSAYEFNKIAAGSELELNWVRPFLTKEGPPSWLATNVEPITVFTGRMSTRLWTLIMKGTVEYVQVYILPTSKLMSFNINASTFKPYLQLEPHADEGILGWRILGYEIKPAVLQPIARELFNSLIRFAKEQGDEEAGFDLVSIGLVPPPPQEDPNAEMERQRQYQQAFLDDLKSHLETRKDSRSANPRETAQRAAPTANEFHQPLPDHIRRELEVLKDSAPQASISTSGVMGSYSGLDSGWKSVPENEDGEAKLKPNITEHLQRIAGVTPTAPPGQSGFLHAPSAPDALHVAQGAGSGYQGQGQPGPRPMPQGQAAPSAGDGQMMQPPAVPAHLPPVPNPNPQTSGIAHLRQQGAQPQTAAGDYQTTGALAAQGQAKPAPMNLPAALSLLIVSLDREMEVVAKAGADAFAQRDLARADAALKFTARLSEYRQLSQELLDYYRRKR